MSRNTLLAILYPGASLIDADDPELEPASDTLSVTVDEDAVHALAAETAKAVRRLRKRHPAMAEALRTLVTDTIEAARWAAGEVDPTRRAVAGMARATR